MSGFKKPPLEITYGLKPSPEMLAKIHEIIEEYCERELEEVVQKILAEKLEKVVRKCLEEKEKHIETEVVELKKIPEKEAVELIKSYIDNHAGCLTSDIIFDLKLAPDLVLKVLGKLEKEKKVRGKSVESKQSV